VTRPAPLYKGRALGTGVEPFDSAPLAWALHNRLYHPTRMTADELITISYNFTGTSDGVISTLSVTGGASGWREGWEPGGTRIATGVQLARNGQSKLGPKLFEFTFETQRITTTNGGSPVTEESVDTIAGAMADNSDEWEWFWLPPTIHPDQLPLSGITQWNEWDEFTLVGAGSSTGGGLTASWSASITVNLT
jgi:hypothetical protein